MQLLQDGSAQKQKHSKLMHVSQVSVHNGLHLLPNSSFALFVGSIKEVLALATGPSLR